MINKLIFFILLLSVSSTFAVPVEFDTTDGKAHVIVIRAIDSWSGDAPTQEKMIKEVTNKTYSFVIADENGKFKNPVNFSLFSVSRNESPIFTPLNDYLESVNASHSTGGVTLFIDPKITLTPERFENLKKNQSLFYKIVVINQGNPRTLSDRVSNKKILANVVGLGTLAIGMDKLGFVNGFNIANGSGIPNDLANLISANSNTIIPTPFSPNIEPNEFKSIDIRRARRIDTVGQIIIAYRGDPSTSTEAEALSKAVIYSLGFNTSIQAILESRESDYNARLAIWDECVAQGQCK